MSKIRDQRIEKIRQKLVREGTSTIDELARLLNVSNATIRRDLKIFENEGLVIQTIGGGVRYGSDIRDKPLDNHSAIVNIDQKIRIGEYCVSVVKEHDEIIIGPGTTTLMAGRILSGISDIKFRLITNSLELSRDLSGVKNIQTVLLGGEVVGSYTTGYTTHDDFFKSCHKKHKILFSADGVDIESGITAFTSALVPLSRKMIDVSSSIILLADSSKLGKVTFNLVTEIDKISTLVTDNGAPADFCDELQSRGITVVKV